MKWGLLGCGIPGLAAFLSLYDLCMLGVWRSGGIVGTPILAGGKSSAERVK